jgi:hypothetical protein
MAIPGLGGRMSAEQILGMSTEDFKKKMDGSASKDDVTGLQGKIEEQASTLTALKDMLTKLTTPPPAADPNTQADLDDPTTQLLADAPGFINRQTQGIQATALAAKADVQEMRARQKYAGAFAKYGEELMRTAAAFPVNSRAMDGFWDQHIAMFTGQKYLKGEMEGGNYPSLLGNSTISAQGSMGGDVTDPNRGFTPDQVAYFKDRGIKIAQAAAYRDLMIRDGEPIDIQKYKERIEHAA